jgi:excisionase family DNA binding protein
MNFSENYLNDSHKEGHEPVLLTIKEVASVLGCHKATVYRLVYRGKLRICPAFKRIRIARKEVDRLVAEVKTYNGTELN